MNENKTKLDSEEKSQKKGNLKLASQFIQEYLDEPERFGPIPIGASVVLLPPKEQGDSELRRTNLRMANELAAEGRAIVLWTVGSQEPPASQVLVVQPFFGRDN